MEKVKNHFEEESKEYDNIILKLIPHYKEMIASLIASIPFENTNPIKVLDLGCGTGNTSKAVKNRFPNANITCIDLAENMLEIARYKLSEYDDIEYHVADMREFEFGCDYDLVISSLAMHHLETDEEKKAVYRRIFDSLRKGGVFLNGDNVLGSNQYLEKVNLEKWKEFMLENVSLREIEEKWLPTHYEEDHPSPLIDHLDWLREVGFKDVDVVWKYIIGAVYGGVK